MPADLAASAQPFGRAGLRDWDDALSETDVAQFVATHQAAARARFGNETAAERTPKLQFLALSGGGQWGAFGAGVLEAWTGSGERPEFQGVAGVSAGAIVAPFASLGADCEHGLRESCTQSSTDDLLESTLFSGVLSGAARADTSRLRAVIACCATSALLAAIAAERRKGRILNIGTTNLDAGRPLIWNIGAIANSGEPGALDLARASAAIPVAFPPIFAPVQTPDGRLFDAMHVDGGASSQVASVSPGLPAASSTVQALGRTIDREVFVIVNDSIVSFHQTPRPRITSIGARLSRRTSPVRHRPRSSTAPSWLACSRRRDPVRERWPLVRPAAVLCN